MPRPSSPAVRVQVALIGIVAGSVGMMAHFTARSMFVWDDMVNFREGQVAGLSLRYLFDASPAKCCLGLRFAPAHRLAYWALQEVAPMNFRVAQATALVCFAFVLLVLHRLLSELFGPGPVPVILTLLYGTSPVHVDVIQWWSASLDRLPDTLFSLLCMLAYVYFHRTGSRRWLVLSVLALSVALLFHTKAVLVPLYLGLLHVLVLEPAQPVRDAARAVVRQWRIWAAYAVPVGLYLIVYLNRYVGEGVADPSLVKLGRYLPILWFRIVAPGLFGIYIPKSSSLAVAAPIMVAAQAALVAAAAWTIRRRRTAWRAWVFFAVTFLVNAAIVGLTRIAADAGTFGPNGLAYYLRYNEEITYLVPIALGAALLGAGRAPGRRPGMGRLPTRFAVLVGIGVAFSVGFAWVGAGRVGSKRVWVGAQARPYVENVQAGLRRIDRSGRQVALVDGVAPYAFVPPLQAPYNSDSEVLRVVDRRASFDSTGRDLYEVAPDGAVMPVSFSAESGGDAKAILTAGAVGVKPGTPTFDDRGLCVVAGTDGAVIGFTPPQPSGGGPVHLLLRYGSTSGGLLKLVAEPPGGGGPTGSRLVTMPRGGNQTTVFSLEAQRVQRVYLALSARSEICVQDLQLGRLTRG